MKDSEQIPRAAAKRSSYQLTRDHLLSPLPLRKYRDHELKNSVEKFAQVEKSLRGKDLDHPNRCEEIRYQQQKKTSKSIVLFDLNIALHSVYRLSIVVNFFVSPQ